MSQLRWNVSPTTGTLNGVTAGSAVSGNMIAMGPMDVKVKNLSALVTCLAETNTLTITPRWQVSNDNSTWVNASGAPNTPAGVAIATGTAGADTAVTLLIPATNAVNSARYARLQLVVGVATGASADTYTISYCYRQ